MKMLPEVERFLDSKRIAFVGVSSKPDDFSRAVFRRFVSSGYEVIPVRPDGAEIDGRRSYAKVTDIPGGVDAAFVMTPPSATDLVVFECAKAAIHKVWLHRGAGHGAVSEAARGFCEQNGIDLVAGECPMMFLPDAELIHRVHGAVRTLFRH